MTNTNEKIYSTDGRYSVEFIKSYDSVLAVATIEDGMSYGGSSYWFTIGHYKNVKTATRWACKKMAKFNIELVA